MCVQIMPTLLMYSIGRDDPATFTARPACLKTELHSSLDYCYIGRSGASFTYIIILKDDFSSYVRLVPLPFANAESS